MVAGLQTSGLGSVLSDATTPNDTTLVLPHPTPTPVATATPTPAPTAVATRPKVLGESTVASSQAFGIAGDMASLSSAALATRLGGLHQLGVTWLRYDIDWSNIEASPGQYNWTDYDREIAAVSAAGFTSLGIIDYTPAWARRSDCTDSKMCAPADPATYAQFAAAVVARYQHFGLHDWEIWNEPNNVNFYQPAADPVEYTAMLKASYTAIKQVDGRAFVVTGGTAPADSADGYLSSPDFVRGLYAAGAKGYFDAIAHHPYTWPYSPAWPNPEGAWGQLATIHGIMAANGDGSKKIWVTEFGAPTGGPGTVARSGFSTAEGQADHVNETLQSTMVSDAVKLETSAPWIGPFFWYSYQDAGTASDTVENFFGLLRADGSRKPAYYTYQNLIAKY